MSTSVTYNYTRILGSEFVIYGYPVIANLLQMYLDVSINNGAHPATPINQLYYSTGLATPTYSPYTGPNHDTLYAWAWLDLTNTSIILKTPDSRHENRFWEVIMANFFADQFETVPGTDVAQNKKTYIIAGPNGLILPNGNNGSNVPNNVKIINAPTNITYIVAKIAVKGDNDLQDALDFMNQITITPTINNAAVFTPPTFPSNPFAMFTSIDFYKTVLNGIFYNGYPSCEEALWASWKEIGLKPQTSFDITTLPTDAQSALQDLLPIVQQIVIFYLRQHQNSPFGTGNYSVNTCWSITRPNQPYGYYYLERAFISIAGGIGGTIPIIQTYLGSVFDGNAEPLNGSLHNYKIHFEANQLPKVIPDVGFWSITLYNSGILTLFSNEYNIYAVGTNTGTLEFNNDGSLDIYIQTSPPNGQLTNFIPCPSAPFTLIFRIYLPTYEQINDLSNIQQILPY